LEDGQALGWDGQPYAAGGTEGALIAWMFTAEPACEKMGHAYSDPEPALKQAA
jgi:hypothetical protein